MEVKIDSSRMNVVMIGRVMGAVVIGIALIHAIAWMVEGEFYGVMEALSGLGIAFLILVATEILDALKESNRRAATGDGGSDEAST